MRGVPWETPPLSPITYVTMNIINNQQDTSALPNLCMYHTNHWFGVPDVTIKHTVTPIASTGPGN